MKNSKKFNNVAKKGLAVAFKNKIKKFFNQHIIKKDQKLKQKTSRVK